MWEYGWDGEEEGMLSKLATPREWGNAWVGGQNRLILRDVCTGFTYGDEEEEFKDLKESQWLKALAV